MDFTHSLWLTCFCNIKPFESKIHVCVVLNCTFLLSALGILVWFFFELSDDFALLKTHCWGDALSVFLLSLFWCFIMESLCWIHNKCEALDKDCVLFSSLMVPPRVRTLLSWVLISAHQWFGSLDSCSWFVLLTPGQSFCARMET